MEHYSPIVQFAGLRFDIPVVLMTIFTSVLVFILVMFCTRNMTTGVPKGKQNFFEWVIEFIRGIAGQFMDAKTSTKFITLALTLFLYIFIGNQLGVMMNFTIEHSQPIPSLGITQEVISEHGHEVEHNGQKEKALGVVWFKSPTASPSVTFGLALMILLYAHYLGIRKDAGGYVKHWFQPHPLMFILHVMEEFIIKPLTLPLRLFGNIFAGEVLIAFLLAGSVAVVSLPLIVWLGYSVFVGSIQAYIFTTLALVYISQKVVDDH